MQRVRVFFSKQREAAYISHLDLQRAMARALRRSGMPVWYSQGFNPHIYLSFALPLPLGQESMAESVDCRLVEDAPEGDIDLTAFVGPLADALPGGIEVQRIAPPVFDAGDIMSAGYEICWPAAEDTLVHQALAGYDALPEAPVLRKTKRREETVDLKTFLSRLELVADGIHKHPRAVFRLPAGSELNLNPVLLAGLLEQQFGLAVGKAHILRTGVYTKTGEAFR